MTVDVSTTADAAALPAGVGAGRESGAARVLSSMWGWVESLLVAISDQLNPILVKETRQALKSWQFMLTFVLLLVTCWIVTIGGVAWIGPGIYYNAAGSTLLIAYYAILAGLLMVFVPYAAYRSLAAEREDNTYELLSITTLRAWQIISGKLGSSIAQMLVYFSAITPCLAFTYLLRGVDVPTIAMLLVYSFFASLGLSLIGLLIAALAIPRYGQVFLAVGFVAMLLAAFASAVQLAVEFVSYRPMLMNEAEFLVVHLAIATLYGTTFALVFFAAAGLISFASENRSTPLRLVMLVQQAAWISWMSAIWIGGGFFPECIFAMALVAGGYWYAMGMLLTGEWPILSHRVRRHLPTSPLGRSLLSWLSPGPGSGYLFVVANLTAVAVICLLAIAYDRTFGAGRMTWPTAEGLVCFLIIGWSYVVAYLGLGRLLVAALRRVAVVTMLACFLIHFLLLLAGSGIPMTIQLMSVSLRDAGYTFLQVTNPFYSLLTVLDNGLIAETYVLLTVVPAAAVCVLLLNMPGVVRELRQDHVALPIRVLEDEAQLHAPPAHVPSSPWDEPD